jgi:5-formyltetrahydrofolate cyclo-ligase
MRAGKTVYMAVPRLRDEKCFLELDPAEVADIDHATTVGGSSEVGVPVGPEELPEIDLIVSGSVAVAEQGDRIGKGEGYSDLEFAVLREFGLVGDDTPVATTVHELQVVDEAWEPSDYDVPLDLVVTPDRTVETGAGEAGSGRRKPTGIDWSALSAERLAAIPILDRLQE